VNERHSTGNRCGSGLYLETFEVYLIDRGLVAPEQLERLTYWMITPQLAHLKIGNFIFKCTYNLNKYEYRYLFPILYVTTL
jgi:hypothetical protein